MSGAEPTSLASHAAVRRVSSVGALTSPRPSHGKLAEGTGVETTGTGSRGFVEGHWRSTVLVAALLAGMYLLLLNPYWTPGGDSELFITAARSIVRGEGYTYNDTHIAVAPPGWSLLLAGTFALSPTFLAGKILTLGLMLVAGVLAHRVLLRLGPATLATWSAVLGGALVLTYSLTFWLHSDALFCALGWSAMLLAMRLAEGRGRGWTLLGLVIACGLMATVRWTSALQWGMVAAALAGGWHWHGRPLLSTPRGGRVSLGLSLSGLITVAVFLLLFFGLPQLVEATQFKLPVTEQTAENEIPTVVDNQIFEGIPLWQELLYRLRTAGNWTAWLVWYPSRFAAGLGPLEWISLGLGWIVLGLLGLTAWDALRGRYAQADRPLGRFIWPALVGYAFILALIWPLPNARYLVPVAPLVIMGVLGGCTSLAQRINRPRLGRWLRVTFLISVVVVNGAMYGIDLVVQRSGDRLFGGDGTRYYRLYEAGLNASLLQAAEHLQRLGVADREVAISERYENLGRMRFSKSGTRNAVLLLDRQLVATEPIYSFIPTQIPDKLERKGRMSTSIWREWAEQNGIRYYLYQQSSEPWRLWHFRVPTWLQEWATDKPVEGRSLGWLLFTAEDGFSEPVPLPAEFTPLTRVPGL